MELWIRSQDRKILKKIPVGFSIVEEKKYYIVSGSDKLGEYKSKERALEVLDEIQRILMPNIMAYSPIVKSKDYKNHCMKYELCGSETQYDVVALPTYVYEMPKD